MTRPFAAAAIEAADFTEDYLRDVNAVLETLKNTDRGFAGYYLGAVTFFVLQRKGILPDRLLLEQAAQCTCLAEALRVALEWMVAKRKRG